MSYGQSYGPVYQQEPVYHQNQIYQPNLAAYSSQNDFELHSAAPSFTSSKNVYQGQGGPVSNDATSDYHRLLREPGEDAKYTLWSPGFWIQFPWLGILSILGILASTVASLVILVRSHRQPLEGWGFGIAPSVYLSIASVVANGLTAYALANGLEITFWRYALQGRTNSIKTGYVDRICTTPSCKAIVQADD
ncbi:hypothetical protein BKA63DRAFT_279261 [Paraphoma chrysanthemicola]|nr:hypothetical protein BKA63DRAFT_279261 [Paraphoma chrysanthemicola]